MNNSNLPMRHVSVAGFKIGNDLPFTLIAGPCALESRDHAFEMADALVQITQKLGVSLVYKTSFDKANRTSLRGNRGVGIKAGLPVLADVREKFNIPVITDVHTAEQCAPVAEVVDILQIPAFLCRQTDLLIAAAATGKVINVKKGQFLAPWDMKNVAAKLSESGNDNILLCERGVTFGYNTLVNDMRALPIMAQTGYPIVFDATHSVQQPGGAGSATSGDRTMVPYLARAAIATGCVAAVFAETHQDPDKAPSDGPNMMFLRDMPELLTQLVEIDRLLKPQAYEQRKVA